MTTIVVYVDHSAGVPRLSACNSVSANEPRLSMFDISTDVTVGAPMA